MMRDIKWKSGIKVRCVEAYEGRKVGDIRTLDFKDCDGDWHYKEDDGMYLSRSYFKYWIEQESTYTELSKEIHDLNNEITDIQIKTAKKVERLKEQIKLKIKTMKLKDLDINTEKYLKGESLFKIKYYKDNTLKIELIESTIKDATKNFKKLKNYRLGSKNYASYTRQTDKFHYNSSPNINHIRHGKIVEYIALSDPRRKVFTEEELENAIYFLRNLRRLKGKRI